MEKDKDKLDQLGKILAELPPEKLPENFDERFWQQFEASKNIPLHPGLTLLKRLAMPAALAAAVLIASSSVLLSGLKPERPKTDLVYGTVKITSDGGRTDFIEPGRVLRKGDVIETDDEEWVVLEFEKAYRFKIEPNSKFRLQDLKTGFFGGSTVLRLDQGKLLISIGRDKHPIKYPMEIHTPHSYARALGTQFSVQTVPGEDAFTSVGVYRGEVRVGRIVNGRKIDRDNALVSTGHRVTANANSLAKPQAMIEETMTAYKEQFQFNRADRVILLIGMSTYRVRDLLKPCAIFIRYENKTPVARKMIQTVRIIQEAQENKDAATQLEAVRQLEDQIKDQLPENRVSLALFTGAYYSHLKKFEESVRLFEDITERYPDSRYRPLALLASAIIHKKSLRNYTRSSEIAIQILTEYPDSFEVVGAKAVLGYAPKSEN